MATGPKDMPETLEEIDVTVRQNDLPALAQNFPELNNSIEEPQGLLDISVEIPKSNPILDKHRALSFNEAYDTVSKPIGKCLIISNKTFDDPKYDERMGTDIDCQNCKNLFEQLEYVVTVRQDQTKKQIIDECTKFVLDADFDNYSSCVLVIMSHGHNQNIIGKDGKAVAEKDIIDLFNHKDCKLTGKPKLVIIQACRVHLKGDNNQVKKRGWFRRLFHSNSPDATISDEELPPREEDESATENRQQEVIAAFDIVDHLRSLNCDDEAALENSLPPVNADLLIAHSTLPGYLSWRNRNQGSWFIQAIVQVFSKKYDTEHVLDMFTMVNDVVSKAFRHENTSQMPSPTNHLRKKFYFFRN